MNHFRATHASGEVAEYDADLPQPEHLTSDWRLESISVASSTPDPEAQPAPVQPIKITKLAFRNRFTQAEKVGIEIASLDDPAAAMQSRAAAASLRSNQADIAAASHIDLNYQDTRTGVGALEAYGLIAAGRATAILDTPPNESEMFNGK